MEFISNFFSTNSFQSKNCKVKCLYKCFWKFTSKAYMFEVLLKISNMVRALFLTHVKYLFVLKHYLIELYIHMWRPREHKIHSDKSDSLIATLIKSKHYKSPVSCSLIFGWSHSNPQSLKLVKVAINFVRGSDVYGYVFSCYWFCTNLINLVYKACCIQFM